MHLPSSALILAVKAFFKMQSKNGCMDDQLELLIQAVNEAFFVLKFIFFPVLAFSIFQCPERWASLLKENDKKNFLCILYTFFGKVVNMILFSIMIGHIFSTFLCFIQFWLRCFMDFGARMCSTYISIKLCHNSVTRNVKGNPDIDQNTFCKKGRKKVFFQL